MNIGSYFLKVRVQDLSENRATDYQIRFEVGETSKIINAGVSPNPSKHWFRFYVDLEGSNTEKPVVIKIYDLIGREIKHVNSHLKPGLNEWFWEPENLPAGVYFYQINVDLNAINFAGDAIEGFSGKLIWLR